VIYFIINDSDTAIKIGYTSSDPLKRLESLQVGHHERLQLLAVTEGDQAAEMRLHSIFADDRLNGEWFRPSDYLTSTIRFLGEEQPKRERPERRPKTIEERRADASERKRRSRARIGNGPPRKRPITEQQRKANTERQRRHRATVFAREIVTCNVLP
jgi:hypothetical protein